MNNEQIVNSIKALCKNHDITITKLEETLGLSQGLISRWNKSEPSLGKIIDIADYFNASLDEVVGRGNIVNDKFIEKLIMKTDNGELKWNSYKTKDGDIVFNPKQYYDPQTITTGFISQEDADDYYNTHKEISYFTEINEHYISIYGTYEYYKIKRPNDLKLFIQPDSNASLIEQDYSYDQLNPLWLKVLFTLDEQAPDEIKVEEFKNSFVFEDDKEDQYKNYNISSIKNNPALIDILETINTDEFIKLQQMFTNPEFQTAIKAVNAIQEHFNKKGYPSYPSVNQKED